MNFDNFEKTPVVKEEDSNIQETAIAIRKNMDMAEINAMTDLLDVQDLGTIVKFGSEQAEAISSCSDEVLRMLQEDKLSDPEKMMKSIKSIMGRFDSKELEAVVETENKGFLSKLTNRAEKQINSMKAKYQTMEKDLEKVYIQLKSYEHTLEKNNEILRLRYEANMDNFKMLQKYIVAVGVAREQLGAYKSKVQAEYDTTGDADLGFKLQNLKQAEELLAQKEHDLMISENLALQSIPKFRQQERNNYNLARKLVSSFLVTLPVFKSCLADVLMMKQEALIADSLSMLDEKTNELLLKSAENQATQAVRTTQLATGTVIKMETLQKTWKTMMDGADACAKIALENADNQKKEQVALEEFKKTVITSAITAKSQELIGSK